MSVGAFNVIVINSTVLGGVESPNYDRREEQKPLANDGTVHQTGSSVINAFPMCSYSTVAVRALIILIGTSAQLPFLALDGSAGVQMYGLLPAVAGPGYQTGSVHALKTAISGDHYIKTLHWTMGDVAKADCEAFFIGATGTTDPVTTSTAAAPTLPINTEQAALATVVFGSTTLANPTSWSLSVAHKGENNEKDLCCNAGLPFPVLTTKAGIGGTTEILLDIETLDLTTAYTGTVVTTFNVLNPLGVGQGATGFIVTLNGTITRDQAIKGASGQPGKRSIQVRGTYNGTTRPLTFSTF